MKNFTRIFLIAVMLALCSSPVYAAGLPTSRQCWSAPFDSVQIVPDTLGYLTGPYAGRCDAQIYVDTGDVDFRIDIREDNDGNAPPHQMVNQGSFGPTGSAHGSAGADEEAYRWTGAHGRTRLNITQCGAGNGGVCHGTWWLCCSGN